MLTEGDEVAEAAQAVGDHDVWVKVGVLPRGEPDETKGFDLHTSRSSLALGRLVECAAGGQCALGTDVPHEYAVARERRRNQLPRDRDPHHARRVSPAPCERQQKNRLALTWRIAGRLK